MSARELLELAAKAAGFAAHQWDEGMQAMRSPAKVTKYGDAHSYWNPLADDGDALRLAVKLGLTINPYKRGVFVSRDEDEPVIREEWGDDDASTTRRAIVRFAAEIARAADAGGKEG